MSLEVRCLLLKIPSYVSDLHLELVFHGFQIRRADMDGQTQVLLLLL